MRGYEVDDYLLIGAEEVRRRFTASHRFRLDCRYRPLDPNCWPDLVSVMNFNDFLPKTPEDEARIWTDLLNQREISNDELLAFRRWRATGDNERIFWRVSADRRTLGRRSAP